VGTSIAPCPDYAVLAQAFGAHVEKVEEPSDVRSALERGLKALSAGRAAIIDMRLGSVN
jgi:thiamine pyrophosphate-dependent acetolactate synthase large subunit-like protein